MTKNKKELKGTRLNHLVLNEEERLNNCNIDEIVKCDIMLGITAIVTECVKNPPAIEDGIAIHDYCRKYAKRYCELSEDPFDKLLGLIL